MRKQYYCCFYITAEFFSFLFLFSQRCPSAPKLCVLGVCVRLAILSCIILNYIFGDTFVAKSELNLTKISQSPLLGMSSF